MNWDRACSSFSFGEAPFGMIHTVSGCTDAKTAGTENAMKAKSLPKNFFIGYYLFADAFAREIPKL